MQETEEIKVGKYLVRYDNETHTYYVDGNVIPSITQILKHDFEYSGSIPEEVLQRARERGNNVHKAVELYETMGLEEDIEELKNYIWLKQRYRFDAKDVEKIVVLELDGKPVACGRLDMVIEIDGELAINDLKSTHQLNYDYLYYQTNLYRIAHNQTYGTNIKRCYATHLKGKDKAFKKVLVNDEIPMKLVKDFMKKREEKGND